MDNRNIAIIGICNVWDDFRRRDRRIMEGLVRYQDIKKIIYVVDNPLTLPSLIKYLFGKREYTAEQQWRRIFKDGVVAERENGRIVIIPSFSIIPLGRIYIGRSVLVYLMNQLRIYMIRNILKKTEYDQLVLWISTPYDNYGLIGKLGENHVIYNLCENHTEKHTNTGYKKMLVDEDKMLTKKAGAVIVASQTLYEERRLLNDNVHLVSNGVDYDEISAGLGQQEPEPIRGISKPIIGYVGMVCGRLDYELLEGIAKRYSAYSIVLIGPIDKGCNIESRMRAHNNIHLLGPVQAHSLPAYLMRIDLFLLLYKQNYQNMAGNSMKLYQYLATGKPIISYPVAGAQEFQDVIYMAKDQEEYIGLVKRAIFENSGELKERRIEYARSNSWGKRIEQIHNLITTSMIKDLK